MAIRLKSSRILRYSIGGAFVLIGILWICFRMCSIDHYEFRANSLDVDLTTKQLVTVLEKPYRFCLEITDTSTGRQAEFEIVTISGCSTRFMVSDAEPGALLVLGHQENAGYAWMLDTHTLKKTDYNDLATIALHTFREVAALDSSGELRTP